MKIGFNEATAKGCSTLAKDLELCDKAGFEYIEIRLDMLRDYLATHAAQDLKRFFADHRIKPCHPICRYERKHYSRLRAYSKQAR